MPMPECIIPDVVVSAWSSYSDYVSQHWRLPDLEAMEICLAAAAAHKSPSDPVNLFIVGPPSSGKTSICINSLWALSNTHIIGNLTPKTLYSSYKGCQQPGLLQQLPVDTKGRSDGIFLFKDFTTMLSKRDNDHAEIMGQLREIADGYYSSRTGTGVEPIWKGKITMFAACTYAIDRAWSVRQELGERFLTLRYMTPLDDSGWEEESIAFAEASQDQIGHEPEMMRTMQELVKAFMAAGPTIPKDPPALTPEQRHYISRLGHFACMARRGVHRSGSSHEISEIDPRESPARLTKGLSAIARWHANIFRKAAVDAQDLRMAYRVAVDTIPRRRWQILSMLPSDGSRLKTADLLSMTGMLRTTMQRLAEELVSIGLISYSRDGFEESFIYQLSDLGQRAMQYAEKVPELSTSGNGTKIGPSD